MLRQPPLMVLVTLIPCTMLSCIDGAGAGPATDSNSILDECPIKADFSLMQRAFRSGMAESVSDSPPEMPGKLVTPTLDEAHLLQLAESGGEELAASAEKLAEWEDEVEKLAAHLQQRRTILEKLRAKLVNSPDRHMAPMDAGENNSLTNSSNSQELLIVPVPYYMHHRPRQNVIPNKTVAKQWYGDIIGDALDPTSHADSDKKHQSHHSHIVILFLFGSLVVGSCLQILLDRWAPAIPYTCGLFLMGSLISWIHYLNRFGHQWTSWYISVDMWQDINPHLLFYIFLPALLFGDVMKLKVQLVKVCSGQIFLLACPGVVVGTVLVALFGKFVLPYGWDWPICLVFGSILSATDPVAVVSLFNSLGVSPRLTMLISGESLVNDGTAIVLFALALKVAQGAALSPLSAAYFFVYMIIPAIIIGFAIGFASVALISFCSEVVGESDAMIQVVVTICCGYLAFFISENEFSSSGVIATVSAGLAVAHSAWPLFVSRETVHIVWEAVEFVGNTVIFFLAGVIFAGTVLDRHFQRQDFMWLLILYVGCLLIRALVVALFWLPLNMAGQPLQWQEGLVMVWSGLRGAVSLAMGMIVDIEPGIDNKTGSQVMFHVGGIAALTLIINSTTIGPLLRFLSLVKTENLMNRVSAKLSTRITEKVKQTFVEELRNTRDVRFHGANSDLVCSMVPMLQPQPDIPPEAEGAPEDRPVQQTRHHHLTFLNEQINIERKLAQAFREVFLRVVQSRYWQSIADGVIPRQLMVSRVLLHSTEEALDNTEESLKDWDIITKALSTSVTDQAETPEPWLSRLVGMWPLRLIPQLSKVSIDFQTMMTVFVVLSYIEAHSFAQEEIPQILGRDDALGVRVRRQVSQESVLQRQKALDFLARLPAELVEVGKSEMLARRLLRTHVSEIEEKVESGFLTKAEADHLSEPAHVALRAIADCATAWRDRLPSKDKDKTKAGEQPQTQSPQYQPRSLAPVASQVPLVDAMQQGFWLPRASDPGGTLLPGMGSASQIHEVRLPPLGSSFPKSSGHQIGPTRS